MRSSEGMDVRYRANAAISALALLMMTGCAGSTINSGVGDTILQEPPYYAGLLNTDSTRIGHLPVAYQRRGTQEAMFDPRDGNDTPVARLLAEMNAYMDSLGNTLRVAAAAPAGMKPPDVQFGCTTSASDDCGAASGVPYNSRARMRLAVARPSGEWTAWAASATDSVGVGRLLVLTLEVGQYWPRQKNLMGGKEVELGTGHVASLPWLTSLDDPVRVLQLTGALVGRDGRSVRIGAEGLFTRRSTLLTSALGAQRLITDEDVEQLRASRRDDLPEKPLVWQVALRNLVRGLTGGAF